MMRNISLKKSVFLISLALLFPEIVVSKTLDLNYDNSANLALSPRSALQLNACHTKADPMLINVNFDPMKIGNNFAVTLEINGDVYTKNYVAVNSSSGLTQIVGVDPDFLIPWEVLVSGTGKGAEGYTALTPSQNITTGYEYKDTFCFTRTFNQIGTGAKDAAPSSGYIPILTTTTTTANFDKWIQKRNDPTGCDGGNRQNIQSDDYYWPDYFHPSAFIDGRNNGENDFLFNHIFYRTKKAITTTIPGSQTIDFKPFNLNFSNDRHGENSFVYQLPLGAANNKGVRIDNGNFSFKLSNRNVSSIKLTITNSGTSEVWNWSVGNDDPYKNTLHLTHTASALAVVALGNAQSDPYFSQQFYTNNNGYYKGTLAGKSSLNQNYTQYIKNVKPLSLPPDSSGDINLVNTDSLTLIIGQVAGTGGGANSVTFRAYGEPLKFAPLHRGGSEVISAMQFRNACY